MQDTNDLAEDERSKGRRRVSMTFERHDQTARAKKDALVVEQRSGVAKETAKQIAEVRQAARIADSSALYGETRASWSRFDPADARLRIEIDFHLMLGKRLAVNKDGRFVVVHEHLTRQLTSAPEQHWVRMSDRLNSRRRSGQVDL